jgi:hypothetical protein
MLEMRGFDGPPMFFFLNEGLPFPTMGADDVGSDPRFNHLNQRGFGHSVFLLSLRDTLSWESHKSPLAQQQTRERV